MSEDVAVRQVTPADFAWIVALMRANSRDAVPADERASRGFVQGRTDEDGLARRLALGPGMWLAEVGGQRAGVALASAADAYPDGPAGGAVELARREFAGARLFLYGPVVVATEFRRRGVLTHIVNRMLADTAADFDYAIAFAEVENPVSVTVHEHLGFRNLGTFTARDREFAAFAHATTAS